MTKTSTKDEGLFSALTCTFEDENILVIKSGASRHMKGENKKLKTLSRENIPTFLNLVIRRAIM